MGFTTEPAKLFGANKGTKIMCVDTCDNSCVKELKENNEAYSLVQFYRSIPKGMLDGLTCKSSINISLAGKEITDISGLQQPGVKIANIIFGLIERKAIESAPFNRIVGLESLRISYLDGIQMRNIHGATIKKLFREEVSKIKGALDLAHLPDLEHLQIMKLGSVASINLLNSAKIKHLVLEGGKKMQDVILSKDLAPINYMSLRKVPLAIAEKLSLNSPKKVMLEPNDIFKSKQEAQRVFNGSEILWD